jgi:hypothetical protein
LLNEGGGSILFEVERGVGLPLQVLVDRTALVIGGVFAITENTADCTRTVLSLAMEGQVVTGAFDATRMSVAVVFCVLIALAISALGNLSFMPWRFKLNFTMLKEFNIEYILIVRSRLEVNKKHWEW